MSFTKNDHGKPALHLLPPDAILEVGRVLAKGAEQYGEGNWKRCPPDEAVKRYAGAALRHLMAILDGENIDPQWGYVHAAHLSCCALFLTHFALEAAKQADGAAPEAAPAAPPPRPGSERDVVIKAARVADVQKAIADVLAALGVKDPAASAAQTPDFRDSEFEIKQTFRDVAPQPPDDFRTYCGSHAFFEKGSGGVAMSDTNPDGSVKSGFEPCKTPTKKAPEAETPTVPAPTPERGDLLVIDNLATILSILGVRDPNTTARAIWNGRPTLVKRP